MSLFKDILGSNESLFKNPVALDFDYQPKLILYREPQQRHIATCIKPLFNNMNGRNLFIYGPPGIGKTVACRHVVNELEETTDDIIPIYINCWQKNTSFKIILELCEVIGYKFTHNKKTEELFKIVKQYLNKKSVVFVFDEIDKVEDLDFIYSLLEEIYRKSVILITNYKSWLLNLDERVKSRLLAEMLEFKPYNQQETKGILKERMKYAFTPGVWEDDAFEVIANKTFEMSDIRSGLYLMKEAATVAEEDSSRKITMPHVNKAITKLDEFNIKDPEELEDYNKFVLDIIKENSDKKIGDLHKIYLEKGGKRAYKSFQRKIKALEDAKFITTEKVTGVGGNTTIVKYKEQEKKLSEF